MTERDIEGALAALESAIKSEDENVGLAAAMILVRCALVDLHRIADVVETLAQAAPPMTPEIEDALEAACSVAIDTPLGVPIRRVSPEKMWARIKEFLRQVPEGITVQELLDEL